MLNIKARSFSLHLILDNLSSSVLNFYLCTLKHKVHTINLRETALQLTSFFVCFIKLSLAPYIHKWAYIDIHKYRNINKHALLIGILKVIEENIRKKSLLVDIYSKTITIKV